MAKYKTLAEMEIMNPAQIERYSVKTIDKTDILRIIYKRKKGSFLPTSKRYRFPRIKKTTIQDSGTRNIDIRWEKSSFLQRAVAELDQIISAKFNEEKKRETILDEMKRLEEDIKIRVDYISSLIEDL